MPPPLEGPNAPRRATSIGKRVTRIKPLRLCRPIERPVVGRLHTRQLSYYDKGSVEIHPTAYNHQVAESDILHALHHALAVVDLEPDADPPKVLAIGPDSAGNLLEIIWIELAEAVELVIHAMPLRPAFYRLLPRAMEDDR